MTHLSDFSYLQRVALEIYTFAFLVSRVWSNDRFRCLHPKKIMSGELRGIATIVYFVAVLMQTSWDVISTWIKYTENFIEIPDTGVVMSKPFTLWSLQHQQIAKSIDYVECVTLSMQTGLLFLMQCFWHYLSRTVAKKTFMSSLEFRFYIIWAFASMAVFPILQWHYRHDATKREVIPQLAYSTEVFIAATLGIRTHMRFKRLVKLTRSVKDGPEYVLEKIIYFKDMNFLQTITLYVFSISLGILCVDGLTETKTINLNKFASDLLISNLDACSIILWIIGISIFQPRRSITEIEESIITESQRTYGGAASSTINRFDDQQASSQSIQCTTNFTENGNHSQFVRDQFSKCMSPIEVERPVTDEEIDGYLNMIDLKSKHYNMKPTVSAPFGALPPLPKGHPKYIKSNCNACAHRLDPIIEKDSRECL